MHKISLVRFTDAVCDALAETMEHHYLDPASFRAGIDGETLARVLQARLPNQADDSNGKRDRAGDLGELLGIEWVRRYGDGRWEVCCSLRWKESIRPRRGEDIVAINWNVHPVALLKGEAKAGNTISGATVADARNRLDQDSGWPSPFTIDFLAQKLENAGRVADATRLFDERFKTPPRATELGCTHVIFLFSGGDPSGLIATHGATAAGTVHQQVAAVLICPDYEAVRDGVHRRAIENARKRGMP